jgi:hypothetical protein
MLLTTLWLFVTLVGEANDSTPPLIAATMANADMAVVLNMALDK